MLVGKDYLLTQEFFTPKYIDYKKTNCIQIKSNFPSIILIFFLRHTPSPLKSVVNGSIAWVRIFSPSCKYTIFYYSFLILYLFCIFSIITVFCFEFLSFPLFLSFFFFQYFIKVSLHFDCRINNKVYFF